MTQNSPAGKGPVEARLAYKLRDITDRIRILELRRLGTIGKWRLGEDPVTGDLIATYTPTGTTYTLATVPTEEA